LTAGWLTEFVESKARAGGGRPGHLGNETLTRGTSHAPLLADLVTLPFQRIFIGQDTLTACFDGARNIPPTVSRNFEKMKTLKIILIIGLLSVETYGQTDFNSINRKKIHLKSIDTTETFIYETNIAILYFSQSDLLDYFSKKPEKEKIIYQSFIDTLILNKKNIEIKCDSIYDKVYEFDRGNGMIEKGEFPSGNDKRDYLMETFRYVAADLILQGKVLPFSKVKGLFETKTVICKKEEGLMGSQFLVFKFPDKTTFYQIITAFGE
jgi:hypothetical protein